MLAKHYTYYLGLFIELVFASPWGWAASACLLVAVIIRLSKYSARPGLSVGLTAVGVALFITGLYQVEYVYELSQVRLNQAKEYPDDADCGSAWTDWRQTGSGFLRECPKGCYKGITLQQKMKLTGFFPPWPKTNRELKCWVRTPAASPVASVIELQQPQQQ